MTPDKVETSLHSDAKVLSSVQKGDAFEDVSFNLIEKALHDYKLGLIPGNCRVCRKKGYYSIKRNGYIIFDLTIEVWLEGAPNYSLINIIECKNYAKKVPVDDVEEFYAKIKQIGDVNVKGIFITNNGFQQGAFNFAKSVGMMLIIVNDLITLNIILHKANRFKQLVEEQTYQADQLSDEHPAFQQVLLRKIQRKLDKEILGIFIYQVGTYAYSQQSFDVPFLSALDIEEFTNDLLRSYDSEILQGKRRLDWGRFSEFLTKVYELSITYKRLIQTDAQGRKIISSCSFLDKTLEIDASLEGSNRAGFLLAHELGHYFLHNRIVLNQHEYESFNDSSYNLSLDRYELNNPRTWIEWQANHFAANLMMPREAVLTRLGIEQDKEGLRIGRQLYVDDQRCNQITFQNVITNMARFFNTTKTSVIYRLNALEMIKFNNRLRSVGQLIREMYPELLTNQYL